ncbi:MAG: AAA family ATPase [Dysgonamonadaceae bacterium]|jgi:MinD-like ATPase involved in chromosome partitioning or flagellar assembly/lipoprotein NlpI|nr:AAA family ATPase [Dysgonamonadaceae bacterium]
MKTVTFYSYKGGVGRTLAVVNIANRLAEFGKKVCVMDFDLEAPGLNHKYKHNIDEVKQGLVDYIYEFAVNGVVPGSIGDYAKEITKYKYTNEKDLKKRQNNIIFIPAGNPESGEYWKKLSHISWWNLFYEANSEGIPFFLDLKEKIKKEFNPDYLLIDTRTGITEISAITMSILADSIVLLAVNNEENICGTQRIIETITKEENKLLGVDKEIHFVLTRLPQIASPEEWTRDENIQNGVKRKIEDAFQNCGQKLNSFNVIHSNKEIALYDRVTVNYDLDGKNQRKDSTPSISAEYLSLFDSLTENDLTKEERERFNNLKRAEILLQYIYDDSYKNSPDLLTKLDEIEKLAPRLPEINLLRGTYFYKQKKYEYAIKYFTKSIELNEPLGRALLNRGESYLSLRNYQKALDDYNEYVSKDYKEHRIYALINKIIVQKQLGVDLTILIIELQELIGKYPNNSDLYNTLSCMYREKGEYDSALTHIYKAIELNPNSGILYSTLAEINFCLNNKLEFYRNLDEALNKRFNLEGIEKDTEDIKNIYKQASSDPEFVRILNKHNKAYFIDILNNLVHEEN